MSNLRGLGNARVRANLDVYNLLNANTILNENNRYALTSNPWQNALQIVGGRLFKVSAQFEFWRNRRIKPRPSRPTHVLFFVISCFRGQRRFHICDQLRYTPTQHFSTAQGFLLLAGPDFLQGAGAPPPALLAQGCRSLAPAAGAFRRLHVHRQDHVLYPGSEHPRRER